MFFEVELYEIIIHSVLPTCTRWSAQPQFGEAGRRTIAGSRTLELFFNLHLYQLLGQRHCVTSVFYFI